jgi:hypothetical protein
MLHELLKYNPDLSISNAMGQTALDISHAIPVKEYRDELNDYLQKQCAQKK